MRVELKTEGLDSVREVMKTLSGPKMREAQANALNDVGYAIHKVMKRDIASAFDRVTPWVGNSPWINKATPDKLNVSILPTRNRSTAGTGGKVGVDPQYILQAQEFGNRRADKKSEILLRRMGILPNGYQTTIPAEEWGGPYPGSVDQYGNLKGSFLQQLLSYLQAFGEQGYKGNMTAKRKKAVHKGTAKMAGRRYFISYGRMRGDPRSGHLGAGIWAASGMHGVVVRPVLMFARVRKYTPRISMDRIYASVDAEAILATKLRYRIRQAAGV